MEQKNKNNGLAIAGLVLGIISICISFIAIINNACFFLGILSIIFGIISLVKKSSKGISITSLVLGIVSIVIAVSLQISWANALNDLSNDLNDISNDLSNDLDTMTGKNTDEVLKNLDINIGTFQVTTDKYGFNDTKLTVKITNKTNDTKSFSLTIEAVTSDGSRIDTDYIYANDLTAGQSQSFDLFTYVSSDEIEEMKSATFNIVKASMY